MAISPNHQALTFSTPQYNSMTPMTAADTIKRQTSKRQQASLPCISLTPAGVSLEPFTPWKFSASLSVGWSVFVESQQ
jgi:hypothetical protein